MSVALKQFVDTPIDEVRSYWNERPCNIRHSPRTPGTREYFDYQRAWPFRWMPRLVFRALERTLGWHLLITARKGKK